MSAQPHFERSANLFDIATSSDLRLQSDSHRLTSTSQSIYIEWVATYFEDGVRHGRQRSIAGQFRYSENVDTPAVDLVEKLRHTRANGNEKGSWVSHYALLRWPILNGDKKAQLSIYLAEFVFIWRVHPVFSHLLRGDTVRVTQRPFNAGYVRHGPAHVTGCRRRCGWRRSTFSWQGDRPWSQSRCRCRWRHSSWAIFAAILGVAGSRQQTGRRFRVVDTQRRQIQLLLFVYGKEEKEKRK